MTRIHIPATLALAGVLATSCASRKKNFDIDKAMENQAKIIERTEKQIKKDQEASRKKSGTSSGGSSW